MRTGRDLSLTKDKQRQSVGPARGDEKEHKQRDNRSQEGHDYEGVRRREEEGLERDH